ncbi:MAG: alpha/beta hydrolase [Flavobacteriales bacterium]|nr:alpha/beta hydrolase [Flavobacteriales bacterium]
MTHTFHSTTLREDRTINVYLPDNYHTDPGTDFPVIYLLDGSANEDFVHIAGLVQFLVMTGKMDPCIVVGIGNVDRKRDFTFPTTVEQDKIDFPTTGGSSAFISFLGEELLPLIKQQYRIGPTRIFIGQSLGGLLAAEVLLKHPDWFSHYVIVSPSIWWNNESILADYAQLGGNLSAPEARALVAVGKEGKEMVGGAKKLVRVLKSQQHGPQTSLEYFPAENHLTILHNAVYACLLKIFNP